MTHSSFTFFSLLNELNNYISRPSLLAGGIVLFAFLLRIYASDRRRNSRGLPFPPGPKPLPLVGNLLQVNTAEPWLTYTAWRKKYGDLLHVCFLGQNFIILNSERTARALIDQRSALYSDRLVVRAYSMLGVDYSTALLPYGDEWRLHRKVFQYTLRTESEVRNQEIYLRRVRTLLANLLDAPQKFEMHIKNYVASNVMAIAYGYEMVGDDDPMIRTVKSLVDMLSELLSPERCAILSAFPFLEQLPGWLPGGKLWRDLGYVRKLSAQVREVPFNWVKDRMMVGNAPPSMVADCLSQLDQKEDNQKQEDVIKSTAATTFTAGFETSSSTLHAFILAMVLHPEVQAKAQAEIDAVIGSGRLPCFDDRDSLPYVDAILRELVRWRPVLPLGFPHSVMADDVYEGYHIPKGAVVLMNIWAMGRDEDSFTDVVAFKPERFLTEEGKLKDGQRVSAHPIFGLGRRICPGRFISEAFVWTAVVSILATFQITKARDVHGREIDVKSQFTTGLSVRPVDFPCCFTSRSVDREDVIRKSCEAASGFVV